MLKVINVMKMIKGPEITAASKDRVIRKKGLEQI
jgi:hypothetical protein